MKKIFTFQAIETVYREVISLGYTAITCREYAEKKNAGIMGKTVVNRVDIDFSIGKSRRLAEIFNKLGIKATFFVRLHASEYNPFSFENYRSLKFIRDSGHEIGYHSEIVDQASIWGEDPAECLRRDVGMLEQMLGIKVYGVASHGGYTGFNNLDFWKTHKPEEFGLVYEAYDESDRFGLFTSSRYVTDSLWTRWKAYENGRLIEGDMRDPAEHALEGIPVLYVLVHGDTYYDKHFYE